MMKKLLSKFTVVLILCMTNISYVNASFNQLPDELILDICQRLPLKDVRRLNQVNQKLYHITEDEQLSWAEAAQKLDHPNFCINHNHISPIYANIIKSVLKGKLRLIVHDASIFNNENCNYIENQVQGVRDDGELIMTNDLDRLGIERHQYKIAKNQDSRRMSTCTEYSSNDGTIHTGTARDYPGSYREFCHSYVVTDLETMTMKYLRSLDNLCYDRKDSVHDISGNGKIIVGVSKAGSMVNGYKWTEQTGMILLTDYQNKLASLNDNILTWAQCTNANGELIGGFSKGESINHAAKTTEPTLWIDNSTYLISNLLRFSSMLLPESLRYPNKSLVDKISPNGRAIYIKSLEVGSKVGCVLVFDNSPVDSIQQWTNSRH